MMVSLEVRLVEAIRRGKGKVLTSPLSWLYGLGVRLRHHLYEKGWLKTKWAPLPVVSVGNLVVGGSGKTQVALLLAQALHDVAILSRGYRGKGAGDPIFVVPEEVDPKICGDEPWLLASRLPTVQVWVAPERYKGACAAKKRGAKVAILDDGMQHRALFRDVEIVVLNGRDPFGGGAFLPKGLLREDPKRLALADLVVFVGKPTQEAEMEVAALTEAPCVEMEVRIKELFFLQGERIERVEGKKVGLFCGIANPNRFVESIKDSGFDVVASHFLPDHGEIGEGELQKFAHLCKEKGAELLLCTEKDKVKLPQKLLTALPIGWAEVEVHVIKNREAWDRIINEINIRALR